MLFIFRLPESIEFEGKGFLLFGLLNDKSEIFEFDSFFFPGVEDGLLNVDFALFFEGLFEGFAFFEWVVIGKGSLEKFDGLFVVLDLLLFL